MGSESSDDLAPQLNQLLEGLSPPAAAERLRRVFLAAANAVHRLSDMDLVRYETGAPQVAPDLTLWEQMAPVIRDSVVDVNALLMAAREQFPPDRSDRVQAPGPLGARWRAAEEAVWASLETIAQQVTYLGEQIRRPEVVADRWTLLAAIQAARSRFRELIGTMVYESASAFGELRRGEVIPGYREELQAAVNVRATVADLNRVLVARGGRIREAAPEDVQWNAQQLEKELDTFGRTPAFRALRAQDKRGIVEFRQQLGALAADGSTPRKALSELVEPFAEFVATLALVNKRELLQAHDRELVAACCLVADRARSSTTDPEEGLSGLKEALALAQGLYGRDPALDAFLRKARKTPPQPGDVETQASKMLELLAALSLSADAPTG